MQFIEGAAARRCTSPAEACSGVKVRTKGGVTHGIDADQLLVFFGLHPKLGPIADWGLELEKRAIKVDTEKFQIEHPGHFRGRRHQHLSGQEEADSVRHFTKPRWRRSPSSTTCIPAKKQYLQYTTTSPVMQKRLGVPD